MQGFREGKFNVLLTTDVAARGLDIPEVDLVIQCNPPEDVDSYIHRSGRTGRAGKNGVCICFYKPEEEMKLANVEYRAVSVTMAACNKQWLMKILLWLLKQDVSHRFKFSILKFFFLQKIKFKRVSGPTKEDIIRASVEDAVR